MSRLSLFCLLALAGCATTMAMRLPGDLFSVELPERQREKDERVYINFRFEVPPNLHEEFMDRWMDWEDSIMKSSNRKHEDYLTLSKANDHNYLFFGYSEWADWESFKDHMKSDESKKFLIDYLGDRHIEFKWEPVLQVGSRDKEFSSADVDEDNAKDAAHVLIEYRVEPGDHEDFIKEFKDMQDATAEKEDANLVYALRKTFTDNYHFYVYGSWKSWKDYRDHVESKHLRKLLDFVADREIAWIRYPLVKVSSNTM